MTATRHRPRGVPGRTSAALATTTLLLATLVGCSDDPEPASGPGPAQSNSTPAAATAPVDPGFDETFEHRYEQVGDIRMHYVVGGEGPPLVLLHGWPQTWFGWAGIMPALAAEHTVYAVDLPGLGDSEGEPDGYDKRTLARHLHELLVGRLDLGPVDLAAHDLGAGVGFQYVAQFPDDVRRYAHLDYPLPGPALTAQQYRSFSWHLAFHDQEEIPEAVVGDDVREYLDLFYPLVAAGGTAFGGPGAESPFTPEEVDEYARTYAEPANLSGGFELYRTLDEDERDNRRAGPVEVPTLLLTAEGSMAATRPTVAPLLTELMRAREVPGSGHWLAEENPRFLTRELLAFFRS